MDKKTFLEELKKSLRVLKDEELEDIIGEYEQHIDMKVQNGLTVEQAIADFGNMKELAAEILEAYHVRAEYSLAEEWDSNLTNSAKIHSDCDSSEEESEGKEEIVLPAEKRSVRSMCVDSIKKLYRKIADILLKIGTFLWNICSWCGRQMKRPFRWMKTKYIGWKSKRTERNTSAASKDERMLFNKGVRVPAGGPSADLVRETPRQYGNWMIRKIKGIGNMISKVWNWMVSAAIWCLRICWNCFVIGTAGFVGGFGLMCLFVVGVLVVLWMQGYPLAGLTIGGLGLTICLFAGAALIWSLMWHKPIDKEMSDSSFTNANAAKDDPANTNDADIDTTDVQLLEEGEGQHA